MLTDSLRIARAVRPGHGMLRVAALGLLLLLLPGCGTTYLLQAARGQWQVMSERRPIERVVADAHTPPLVRERLAAVREMRAFASTELGLPDNASYRSFVSLDRPYVVWNVVAVPEFAVDPQRWCFPVVGCLAYRGYFSERQAHRFAARLERRGFDVFVGGVAAYSTLGRFADPVLSSMLAYGENELAAVLFHELAHQIVYVPGDTTFNESFAVAVEQEGLRRWLRARGRAEELERALAARAQQVEVIALFARRRSELAALYGQPLAAPVMRERKREILGALEADLRALEARRGERIGYLRWFEHGINNAHLASVATYFDCLPAFERLLAALDHDLERFHATVRRLGGRAAAGERRAFCPRPESGTDPAQPARR